MGAGLVAAVIVALAVWGSHGVAPLGATPAGSAPAGRVFVKFDDSLSPKSRLAILTSVDTGRGLANDDVKASAASALAEEPLPDLHLLTVAAGSEDAVVAALATRPGVVFAEADREVRVSAVPNDPCYVSCPVVLYGTGSQWGLDVVRAPGAWDVATGAASVIVAVVDTGVQATHPDLNGRVTGAACSPKAVPTQDDNGHGTFVAGVIAASTDNAVGIASVGRGSSILSVKALDSSGSGTSVDIVNAVNCAVSSGARVINLSIEAPGTSQVLDDAVAYARANDATVIAAAGNFGATPGIGPTDPVSPANSPGAIGVVATARTPVDATASFSSRGTWNDIAAPGQAIVSTCSTSVQANGRILCPGGYAISDGTSFAAPMVAGAAALLLAQDCSLNANAVEARLRVSATRTAATGIDYQFGRLDVLGALQATATSTHVGYWLAGTSGSIYRFGDAANFGSASASGTTSGTAVVGLAATPKRCGYWTVTSAGVVRSYGDARSFGDLTTALPAGAAAPIVAMAATATGNGYWLLGRDGGIFSFGDARFFGSTGALRLNAPVTGIAVTPSGNGYWLLAQDGGVFSYGDARFFGSTGDMRLNQPIFAMARTPSGNGYWLAAFDGGIFAFGDARFFGSTGNLKLNQPIAGMAATPSGAGYWLVGRDGGVFAFGDAPFVGSLPGSSITDTVVAMAAL